MATTGRTDVETDEAVNAVTSAISEADLVRLVVAADGDAVAGAGLLATAFENLAIPYHVGFVRSRARADDHVALADEQTTTLTLGTDNPAVGGLTGRSGTDTPQAVTSVALSAYHVARELGTGPNPVIALAGAASAGIPPTTTAAGAAFDHAKEQGLTSRPGLAIPVDDVVDGITHSTLIHGAFSGNRDVAAETIGTVADCESLTADDHRAIASLVALAVTDGGSDRTAGALHGMLHPCVTDGAFRTVGGTADVITAMADRAPGLGVTTALGSIDRPAALDVWRDHARTCHAAVRSADTSRHRGLFAAQIDGGPVLTVARLLRDFRSPEPTVLVCDRQTGHVALAGTTARTGAALADALSRQAIDRGPYGYATLETGEDPSVDELVATVREGLSQ